MSGIIRCLSADDRVPMSWKNGGGVTTEIACYPTGASLDAFGWRVSLADVLQPGPFSLFQGVDRTLVVLSGNGIRLHVDGDAPRHLTQSSAPFAFPADVPADAALIDGPIVDLNVMTRRRAWRHTIERLDIEGRCDVPNGAPEWLMFCHQGAVRVETQAGVLAIAPKDAVYGTGAIASVIAVEAKPVVFHIAIWPC